MKYQITPGSVVLLGGGPGDPGLMTVSGIEAIKQADVILYDRLAPLECLELAREDCECINVGKIPRGAFTPQEQINDLLVEKAKAGNRVVRLKGGDPFVFGRGGEEWQFCNAAGVEVKVIPGVTSSVAAAALAGIPVTHRNLTQGYLVVSGHIPPDNENSTVNWENLATAGLTIVILMGIKYLPEITSTLLAAGLAADTPAAVIANAGTEDMTYLKATAKTIADMTAKAGIKPPATVVIGEVVGLDLAGLF
ncbi:MAG: uroporphyrinogen-III C-methyltransferase [Propionibacterium sp.]|nr:MAG: uroporphyrinogen-III C-methyltransferase [Propionibacterium sp.]